MLARATVNHTYRLSNNTTSHTSVLSGHLMKLYPNQVEENSLYDQWSVLGLLSSLQGHLRIFIISVGIIVSHVTWMELNRLLSIVRVAQCPSFVTLNKTTGYFLR